MKNKKKITEKDVMKDFDEFTKFMKSGLKFGCKKYGTKGFLEDSHLRMLSEEIRDLASYGYLLYRKIKMIEEGILQLKDIKEFTKEKSKNETTY